METVKIEVPAELLKVANPNATDFTGEAVRLLALGLFREEKVSLGRAANSVRRPWLSLWTLWLLIMFLRSVTDWVNWKKTAGLWPNLVCDCRLRLVAPYGSQTSLASQVICGLKDLHKMP